MDDWVLLVFAFAIGLAVSGVTASALSAFMNARAGFHPPFVRRDNLALSLLVTAIAGPIMLFNDALKARVVGGLGLFALAACLSVTCIWTLSLGILVTELAWRAGILVT